jgi:hypothetical protein
MKNGEKMETTTKNKRNVINSVITVAVLLAIVIVFFSTRKPPEEQQVGTQQSSNVRNQIDRDITVKKLSEAQKNDIKKWEDEKLIVNFAKMSHEAFVDPTKWNVLSKEEKEHVILTLSAYLKSIDGTKQIIIKKHGTKDFLADFFADIIRFEKDK